MENMLTDGADDDDLPSPSSYSVRHGGALGGGGGGCRTVVRLISTGTSPPREGSMPNPLPVCM